MKEYQTAVRYIRAVAEEGKSLDGLFTEDDSPLARQIVYGVIRDWYRLNHIVRQLVDKPLKGKYRNIQYLLLAGIYSIDDLKRPAHASVNNVVSATRAFRADWAKGLVNGVMRNYIRRQPELAATDVSVPEVRFNHPAWLIKTLAEAWPEDANDIFAANQSRGPMVLRVNLSRISREDYLNLLHEQVIDASAGDLTSASIYLEQPMEVSQLPGFDNGLVSIQDEASQLAATLLNCQKDDQVLDCCAAPGGKSCHILETSSDIRLTALDVSAERLELVADNLARLSLSAELVATDFLDWQSDQMFDRILLDAPCSATGIIRRHPDIKLLRRASDIPELQQTQVRLLEKAWQYLRPGGFLLYSTCSVLPAENESVIEQFQGSNRAVMIDKIGADWGKPLSFGRQLLPRVQKNDGFYYARLRKQPA
ncbi:MAG: 16S rRNA (cytosine(967)-C(5))-methyltransferase RsmB [Pseudomonadales bacterium]|nr:16S rRNA (cytosine(967)-C(5))-methyltransferase RsmB [Pseudomonadales bacterium]